MVKPMSDLLAADNPKHVETPKSVKGHQAPGGGADLHGGLYSSFERVTHCESTECDRRQSIILPGLRLSFSQVAAFNLFF